MASATANIPFEEQTLVPPRLPFRRAHYLRYSLSSGPVESSQHSPPLSQRLEDHNLQYHEEQLNEIFTPIVLVQEDIVASQLRFKRKELRSIHHHRTSQGDITTSPNQDPSQQTISYCVPESLDTTRKLFTTPETSSTIPRDFNSSNIPYKLLPFGSPSTANNNSSNATKNERQTLEEARKREQQALFERIKGKLEQQTSVKLPPQSLQKSPARNTLPPSARTINDVPRVNVLQGCIRSQLKTSSATENSNSLLDNHQSYHVQKPQRRVLPINISTANYTSSSHSTSDTSALLSLREGKGSHRYKSPQKTANHQRKIFDSFPHTENHIQKPAEEEESIASHHFTTKTPYELINLDATVVQILKQYGVCSKKAARGPTNSLIVTNDNATGGKQLNSKQQSQGECHSSRSRKEGQSFSERQQQQQQQYEVVSQSMKSSFIQPMNQLLKQKTNIINSTQESQNEIGSQHIPFLPPVLSDSRTGSNMRERGGFVASQQKIALFAIKEKRHEHRAAYRYFDFHDRKRSNECLTRRRMPSTHRTSLSPFHEDAAAAESKKSTENNCYNKCTGDSINDQYLHVDGGGYITTPLLAYQPEIIMTSDTAGSSAKHRKGGQQNVRGLQQHKRSISTTSDQRQTRLLPSDFVEGWNTSSTESHLLDIDSLDVYALREKQKFRVVLH